MKKRTTDVSRTKAYGSRPSKGRTQPYVGTPINALDSIERGLVGTIYLPEISRIHSCTRFTGWYTKNWGGHEKPHGRHTANAMIRILLGNREEGYDAQRSPTSSKCSLGYASKPYGKIGALLVPARVTRRSTDHR
ncbi:hypothetical protein KIN20_034983 [Parelaphostrongylus tenuis]|uniref:Uncharacterized protein n=1 Tax=Parelaphostrongylus tenuis TaxID=148309 RepID=A0AAD5WJL4_PARTN|nr:hypothetical protein KIN20_034983 [Parelaphostrongylus tenuis]